MSILALNAASGEISLSSAFGRWCLHIRHVLSTEGALGNTKGAYPLLMAASGEISLSSPFGQWAIALSQAVDAGVDADVRNLLMAATGMIGRGLAWWWDLCMSFFTGKILVFPLGDSITVGERGLTGGWRARLQNSLYLGTGPYVDSTGRRHGGVTGEELTEMDARYPAQSAQFPSAETWILGGENDAIALETATTIATRMGTLLATVEATNGADHVVRVLTMPPWDTGTSSVGQEANLRFANEVATQRAAGQKVYLHDVGPFLSLPGDYDGISVEHPIDGVYGADGTGTGYGKMAFYIDRPFTATAIQPNDVASFSGLTSLLGWWRADNISGGALVDMSSGPFGNATLFNSPTQGTGAHGQAIVTFDGINQYARTGAPGAEAQAITVLTVTHTLAAGGSLVMYDGASVAGRCAAFINVSDQLEIFAGSSFTDSVITPSLITHAYLIHYNGASSEFWLDGVKRRWAALNPGTAGCDGFTISGSAAGTPTNYLNQAWAEQICWAGSPSEADAAAIAAYVNNRYGLWPAMGETTSW